MNSPTNPRRLLVTGAGSGIGAATAAAAARLGWDVMGMDLRPDTIAATCSASIACDVADEASVEAAFAKLSALWPGGPDAVVHSAGVYRVTPLLDTPAASWDSVLGINARGSFLVARESSRRMREGDRDRSIVLLSSIGAARGDEHEPSAAYSASKGAVTSLTRQLAAELGSSGVRVNAVAPGVIETAMTTLMNDPEVAAQFFATRVPARRPGTAAEVANACLFLASDQSSYISGAVIPVDGGQSVL